MSAEAVVAATLFRDDDLLVRDRRGRGGAACVVTFDSFTDVTDLDRPAFGERVFGPAGIDALHVLSRDNRWYQYPAMTTAAKAVRRVTRDYDRVITYGSSMGGYAALRLAGAVGATVALALSPQWTIDWSRAPWERRWPESSRGFRNVWETSVPPPPFDQAWVVFDPLLHDRRHVAALRREGFNFQEIAIPGGGHPIGAYLSEVDLLRPTVLDVVADQFDPLQFRRKALHRRAGSAQALLAASSRTAKARVGRRLSLLRQAERIAPDNPIVLSRLAIEMAWAGRLSEALPLHDRALRLQPDQPTLLMHLSCSYEIAGDLDAACRVMARACATVGGDLYRDRLTALAGGSLGARCRPDEWFRRLTGRRPRLLTRADV